MLSPGRVAAAGCDVHFMIRPEGAGPASRGVFAARLVLVNTSEDPLKAWSLAFDFRGDEQVRRIDGANYQQTGKRVTLSGAPALPVGKAAIIGVRGDVARPQGPPSTFLLDGVRCTSTGYEVGPGWQPWPAPVAVTDPPSFDELRDRGRPPPPGPGRGGGPGGNRGPGGAGLTPAQPGSGGGSELPGSE